MKSYYFGLLLIAAANGDMAYACNTCGCASGNQYIGLLPQTNTNYIGFQYLNRSFSSTHPDEGNSIMPGTSYENYQTYQLWGRVRISPKIQVMAFAPYTMNTRTQDGMAASTINGMGDATVIANYRLVDMDNSDWHQQLLAGGGVKLPTGKYDKQSVATEDGLPNMQPGTHSWDFVGMANYTIKRHSLGANVDVSHTFTTANSDSYKFGNRTSVGTQAFYQLPIGKLMVLPLAGVRYDNSAKDYTNYSAHEVDEDGGGWQLYATQGVQAYYRKLGLQAACYEPIGQYYASGMVSTKFRFEVGLIAMIK